MQPLICACIQLRSTDIISVNIQNVRALIGEAAQKGAQFVSTPEVTGFMDIRPGGTRSKAVFEAEDECLSAMRKVAQDHKIWLQIGSLAIKVEGEERFANRSFLINPQGEIRARYDKIHMFDVDVGDGQAYRESKAYRPGERAVLANTPIANIGMTICYDVRFGALYRTLAQAGAQIITVPAAFTRVTGEAHWEVLLRARAIENGVFIVAAAQGGKHADGRETYGHSMIVAPWGEVLAEGGTEPGVILAELDLSRVDQARQRVPSLKHDRMFSLDVIEAD